MRVDRIKFERTGGFAGIRFAADVEVDSLPDDQKREILELLDEMDFEELPAKLVRKAPIPDEFVYSISVEADKQEYSIMAGESAIPDEMQPLIEILTSIAKKQARRS